MLTAFGRMARQIRLERDELLKEMADKLEVTSAYLSAVETGKRKIPSDWVDKISDMYKLDKHTRNELQSASEMSAKDVKISLGNANPNKRQAAVCFAKAFDNLSDKDIERIMRIVKSSGKDKMNAK